MPRTFAPLDPFTTLPDPGAATYVVVRLSGLVMRFGRDACVPARLSSWVFTGTNDVEVGDGS
jgi:hypothetical protein